MDLAPDFEEQIKINAAKIRAKLSGATYEDKRMVLNALEMKVKYHSDNERGDILIVSCIIPFAEGEIALHPSRKSSHNYPDFCLTTELILHTFKKGSKRTIS